jgi:hypothetical protein
MLKKKLISKNRRLRQLYLSCSKTIKFTKKNYLIATKLLEKIPYLSNFGCIVKLDFAGEMEIRKIKEILLKVEEKGLKELEIQL